VILMNLTEVKFWDDYWSKCPLPSVVDQDFSFDRCLSVELKKQLTGIEGEAFEVGCAPGKWLAFTAKELSLGANGIEYSEAGMRATLDNLKLLRLPSGNILTGDFFKQTPNTQFDVVMSFGFIEHFENVEEVVDMHLAWLKPGGLLVLGVPNFCGIYYFLQRVLDKSIIDKHNLTIMNLDFFRKLAEKFKLNTTFLGYIGSFEPSLPIARHKYGNPLQFLVKSLLWLAVRIRRFRALDRFNNRFVSSYILAVYKK
jgi:SAM-dependent methyltransferase